MRDAEGSYNNNIRRQVLRNVRIEVLHGPFGLDTEESGEALGGLEGQTRQGHVRHRSGLVTSASLY